MLNPLRAGSPTQRRGQHVESLVLTHLLASGHVLLQRNYHCRLGEIDLITTCGDVLVFTEVRWRRHGAYGGASASVTVAKQRRLMLAARHFLMHHPAWQEAVMRFDVMACHGQPDAPEMHWLQNAFS